MPIESATYINELNTANPTNNDLVGQADDHIRLIKQVLRSTFPNLTGPVNLTNSFLNGLTSTPIVQLLAVPVGGIIMWSGSLGSIPVGWGLCNGSTYTKADASGTIVSPDLRDKFVLGGGGAAAVGDTGGIASINQTSSAAGAHSHTATSGGSHNHGGTVGDTTLNSTHIPSHNHPFTCGARGGTATIGQHPFNLLPASLPANSLPSLEYQIPVISLYGNDVTFVNAVTINGMVTNTSSTSYNGMVGNNSGGGNPHNHSISTDTGHTHTIDSVADHTHSFTVSDSRPPFYTLAFIMKL